MRTGGIAASARTTSSRAAQAIRGFPRSVWISLIIVAAALVAIVAAGGLSRAQSSPATASAGEEVRTSAYAVTVIDAAFTDAVEEQYLEADEGQKLLVMTMLLENLSDRPISVTSSADRVTSNLVNPTRAMIEVDGVDTETTPLVWRGDGSGGPVVLQPGVPSELTLAWSAPEDAFVDGIVAVDVHEPEVRNGAIILSSTIETWNPGEVVARISVEAGR